MFGAIPVTPRSLDEYRATVGDDLIDSLRQRARPLQGRRVLHLSISALGTGLAETLGSLVPLMANLGLDAHWQIIRTTPEFTAVNRLMYEALGGAMVQWSAEHHDLWARYNAMNAAIFDQEYDVVIVHDPQPAGILAWLEERREGRRQGSWVWHCHLDLSAAQLDVWLLLKPYIEAFDEVVFDAPEHAREDLKHPRTVIVPPAIDPLSPKNMQISEDAINTVLGRYAIDRGRPIVAQVSTFDRWNDQIGAIETCRLVREQVPGVQLVLVGMMQGEDQGTQLYFQETAQRAQDDPNLFLLSNLNGIGHLEINAFQRAADVVIQRAVRKGFSSAIAEAQWKRRAVVAGRFGSMPIQVRDGETGFLADGTEQFTARVVELLQDPDLRRRLGEAGHQYIQRDFLITRMLSDYVDLLNTLAS